MVRGCAQRVEALLTSPADAEIDIEALATSMKFQALLRAGFWDEIDRTIRDAVNVDGLIGHAPADLLELWWRRLDAFNKAAVKAGADLPPSLKGQKIIDALEKNVLHPVVGEAITVGMRGSNRRFPVVRPIKLVPPQSV